MNWICAAIVAGLVGTAAATTYMALGRLAGWPKVDMIEIPGSMVATSQWGIYSVGTIFHFAMGIGFALLYAWMWHLGLGEPRWWWGLVFGLTHGSVTLLSLPVMLAFHRSPPEMTAVMSRLAVQVIGGHALYGLVVAATYAFLAA